MADHIDYIGYNIKARKEDIKKRPCIRRPLSKNRHTQKSKEYPNGIPEKKSNTSGCHASELAYERSRKKIGKVVAKCPLVLMYGKELTNNRIGLCCRVEYYGPIVIYKISEHSPSEYMILKRINKFTYTGDQRD